MKLPFRLLAIDIDGTLLNSKFSISPLDLAAVRRAHELGIEIILCTGRRHTFALPIARQLGFEMWLCSSNGAVTRSTSGKDFHRDLLPAGMARRLCAHMKDFRGGTVLTFDRETRGALVLERLDELSITVSRWVESNRDFIEVVQPIEEAFFASKTSGRRLDKLDDKHTGQAPGPNERELGSLERWNNPLESEAACDPIQAMICGTIARMREAEVVLAQFPDLDEVTVLKTQYDERDLCLLDLLNHDCSKGHAVERWAKWRGIPREEVMAIGDNYNDVEMLNFAGLPVIMANSSDDLKRYGWMETLSNDANGIAHALETVLGADVTQLARSSAENEVMRRH